MDSTLTYEKKHQSYYEHERQEILALVPKEAKCILDVGCAAGNLGKNLKDLNPEAKLMGIEIQQGITLPNIYEQLFIGDVEKVMVDMHDKNLCFDCIIFADVLEHLNDVWSVLDTSSKMLNPNGIIIASLPNIRNITILKKLVLNGIWEYEKEGIMDKTHLRFFTKKAVLRMFNNYGLEVQSLQYKEYLPTDRLKRFIAIIIKKIKKFEDIFAFQLIVVAKKK